MQLGWCHDLSRMVLRQGSDSSWGVVRSVFQRKDSLSPRRLQLFWFSVFGFRIWLACALNALVQSRNGWATISACRGWHHHWDRYVGPGLVWTDGVVVSSFSRLSPTLYPPSEVLFLPPTQLASLVYLGGITTVTPPKQRNVLT